MATTEQMPDVPLGPPPPGVIPNFDNPPSWAWETYLTFSICFAFLILFVGMRLYVAKTITRRVAADDYLCAFVVVLMIPFAAVMIHMLKFGYGIHLWNVMLSRFGNKGYASMYVAVSFHALTEIVTKISILLLYLRIITTIRRIFLLVIVGIALSVVGHLVPLILYLSTCAPQGEENWKLAALVLRCGGMLMACAWVANVCNLVTDIFILAIPLPMTWGWRLSIRKQIGVRLILITGLLALAVSITRIVLSGSHIPDRDPFWYQRINLTSPIKVTIGIVCSSVPGCVPLYHKALTAFPRLASFRDWIYSKAGSSRISRSSPLVKGQPESEMPREENLELGEKAEGCFRGNPVS